MITCDIRDVVACAIFCNYKGKMIKLKAQIIPTTLLQHKSQGRQMLTLNLLNFLNGIIHFPFLELSIIIFRDIMMRT